MRRIISVETVKSEQTSWPLRTLSLLVNTETILLASLSPCFFFGLFSFSFLFYLYLFLSECPSLCLCLGVIRFWIVFVHFARKQQNSGKQTMPVGLFVQHLSEAKNDVLTASHIVEAPDYKHNNIFWKWLIIRSFLLRISASINRLMFQ